MKRYYLHKFAISFLVCSFLCSALGVFTLSANDEFPDKQQLYPFSITDVKVTDGIFKHAMDMNAKWLLSLEPDRFMYGFREQAGLEPKAARYGGWEDSGTSGHAFGHYLSACAMMWATTGDQRYYDRLDYIMHEMDTCQQAIGSGFISGFPRAVELFEEIERGDIRTQGFDLNGGWVPMYTLHKTFAGLIDTYRYTRTPISYKVLMNLSNWFKKVFENLTDQQVQKILVSEHGGINESMADLYEITGDKSYLVLAERLNHREILMPMAEKTDKLAGLHANTQVPKVVGAIRQYELGGEKYNYTLSKFFWETVVRNHSYVIGGNSEAEHFGRPEMLNDRLTSATCETCNSYNMLKLTKHLYQLVPDAEKTDFYERVLYNHILASQDPNDGMVCYMSPLESGGHKTFSTPFDSFWCCVGTAFENHAKYNEFIYFNDDSDNLYVNLFIPSELSWKSRGILLTQATAFPESDRVEINIDLKGKQRFTLYLREPGWLEKRAELYVNGKKAKFATDKKRGYISLDRTWSDGDKVTYIIPQTVRSEAILGDNSVRAYLNGPIVLASLLEADEQIPVMLTENFKAADKLVKPIMGEYKFVSHNTHPIDKEFIPYYKTIGARMMVYYNHYSNKEWKQLEESIRKKQDHETWLKDNTLSHFVLGEMQPEREHNFKGENIKVGELEDRKFREAVEGGWFSFEMDVDPNQQLTMICSYWGGLVYNYSFNIYVDGELLAYEKIHNWGHRFLDKEYKMPLEMTKGKNKIEVLFKATEDDVIAGPLFECRIMK